MDNKAILYQHRRLDTNEIFYIGIGNREKRAYEKHGRNQYWLNTVNKYGYIVEILETGLSWESACAKEKELISFYGKKHLGTGILVNLSDGGEGNLGVPMTPYNKQKLSERNKGNTYGKGKKHNEKQREALIRNNKNRVYTQEVREAMRQRNLGYKPTVETINKIKEAVKGKTHNKKMVINLVTGIYYESAREAAECLGIPWSSMRCKLQLHNNKMKNNTDFIYC